MALICPMVTTGGGESSQGVQGGPLLQSLPPMVFMFEGGNLLGEKCLTLSLQTSLCSRCYVGITMEMGFVSAIIAVPHSSPSLPIPCQDGGRRVLPLHHWEGEWVVMYWSCDTYWSCVLHWSCDNYV